MNAGILKLCFICGIILMLCYLSYLLGKSKAEIKIVNEQVEVIKYVSKEKSDIYSKPNASRDELLKLMHSNQF